MFAAALFAAALSCSGPASAPAAPADAHTLLLLRDLSGLSVSPDGDRVAVQVQQASLETDSYRATWCIAPVAGGESA
ncbi:MAG TPA: hypothetical protein PLN53_08180, partial [Terricaulis sp.]|nr:hypothetical protein [Terricaulis sp.]